MSFDAQEDTMCPLYFYAKARGHNPRRCRGWGIQSTKKAPMEALGCDFGCTFIDDVRTSLKALTDYSVFNIVASW